MEYGSAIKAWVVTSLSTTLIGVASTAMAQDPKVKPVEDDHTIVFELGTAGDWSRTEGFHPGVAFAFEMTAIENWLELEIGVTANSRRLEHRGTARYLVQEAVAVLSSV